MHRHLDSNTHPSHYQIGTHRWLGAGQGGVGTSQDTSKNTVAYTANGQPRQIGGREYVWDALGRLLEIRQQDTTLASYRYSHRGERISKSITTNNSTGNGQTSPTTYYLYTEDHQLSAELDAQGRIQRQYLYLADLPLAVIDSRPGKLLSKQELSAQELLGLDAKTILKSWWRLLAGVGAEQVTWLHTNHLGAPQAATDQNGQVVWRARYAAFGAARVSASSANTTTQAFTLNLRLPGQYEDPESGLHYNGQRYYDPSRGEYLTPDPLGTPDGPNPYAYVRYNPLRYIDPDGLILFAFDGTGNTNNDQDLAALGNGISNVWQFRQLYNDGNGRYVSGVGTRHRETDLQQFGGDIYSSLGSTLDMGGNFTGPDRITRMVAYFNAEAELFTDNNKAMDVDIIGFSRGASQARDFANRIAASTKNGWYSYQVTNGIDPKTLLPIKETRCQMINFRFMGLWDTVLSTNLSGTSYNLGVDPAFEYVAQAVALNEYRGNTTRKLPNSTGAFPLESIMGGTVPAGQTRVEMGFIGAHADIGGGFAEQTNGLPLVALNWMVEQARKAGVKMIDPASTIDTTTLIHDKSDNQYCLNGPGCSEDRTVRGGSGGTQRQMTGTGMTYANTGQFISYYPAGLNADGTQSRMPKGDASTGTVDMTRYLQWLRSNGYDLGTLKVK